MNVSITNQFIMKYILISLCATFISCTENCDIQNVGTPFQVVEGETYCFTNNRSVEILEISDSYCPCNANCVWEGEATIRANFFESDGSVNEVIIHETLVDQNVKDLEIALVTKTEQCDPDVATISIALNK